MLLTLLSDFGDRDGFVGAMKGVIATRAPSASVVDLGHSVPHGDIRHASEVLMATAPFFPAGTCHVVVVDPTVGSERRAIALAVDEQLYVGPDNGVFSGVLQMAAGRVVGVRLDNPAFWHHPVSPTFHGRDIFAPAAAHLAVGVPLRSMGTSLDPHTLVRLPDPRLEHGSGQVTGEIVHIDQFGNAKTNLGRQDLALVDPELPHLLARTTAGVEFPFGITYCSVPDGANVAVIGSAGRLELAVNSRSAAEVHRLVVGDAIEVRSLA